MPAMIFLNLPVKDLDKSTQFFTELRHTINEQFTDKKLSCIVIGDTIYLMLLVEPFFKTFTKKDLADATTSTEAIIALSAETREAVDALVDKAIAAGGGPSNEPMDEGFTYARGSTADDPAAPTTITQTMTYTATVTPGAADPAADPATLARRRHPSDACGVRPVGTAERPNAATPAAFAA